MFSNIFEKKKSRDLVDRISRMNLSDMRVYINNRIPDFPVEEEGLIEILHKLLEVDEKTSKRYIEIGDMDSKIKKGFDLVISILTNKKVSVTIIELVNDFFEKSKDIIEKYDKENKQIYFSKFKDAIDLAIENMNARSEFQKKMGVIGS